MKYIHEKYPNIRLLYLIDKSAGTYDEAMKRLGFKPYAISPDFPLITADFVSRAHKDGMRVIPYTVDSKADAQRVAGAGVDAIITNYPDRMFKWLGK